MSYAAPRMSRSEVLPATGSPIEPRRTRRLLWLFAALLFAAATRLLLPATVPEPTVDPDGIERDMRAVLGLIVAEVEAAAAEERPPAHLPVAALDGPGAIEYRLLGKGRYRVVLQDPLRSVEFDARVPVGASARARAGGGR